MKNPFQWVQDLFKKKGPPGPDEAGPPVSFDEMAQRGWVSPDLAALGSRCLQDLHGVIKKQAWGLGPQFRDNTVGLVSSDGRVPFAFFVRDKKLYFGVCVEGVEDFIAQRELPREFQVELGNGSYRGLELRNASMNLARYVSVLANAVKHGKCASEGA